MFLPTTKIAEREAARKAAGDMRYSRAGDERTIHSGGHTEEYKAFVLEGLSRLRNKGLQLGWRQEEYRRELIALLYVFRRLLRQGLISVNRHQRPGARF